eukprot:CAMPEP_0176147708 /NCGR_PEP_ID=MMETSP0120_2-20121206/75301_1 /TAXON_ID=160619 /ORGANISM="Kryptoperidinium foliaceum, Strain CCMP 1326" /LENGTH=76 /DNA_ID=CAMNT_0017484335 /DNA_START=1 /DNA_END=228 /DNA_ORIENTATION=-
MFDQPITTVTAELLMKISEDHFGRQLLAQKWLDKKQVLTDYAMEVYNTLSQEATSCQVQVLDQVETEWRAIVSQRN